MTCIRGSRRCTRTCFFITCRRSTCAHSSTTAQTTPRSALSSVNAGCSSRQATSHRALAPRRPRAASAQATPLEGACATTAPGPHPRAQSVTASWVTQFCMATRTSGTWTQTPPTCLWTAIGRIPLAPTQIGCAHPIRHIMCLERACRRSASVSKRLAHVPHL